MDKGIMINKALQYLMLVTYIYGTGTCKNLDFYFAVVYPMCQIQKTQLC